MISRLVQKLMSNNIFQLARIKTSVNDSSQTKLGSNRYYDEDIDMHGLYISFTFVLPDMIFASIT